MRKKVNIVAAETHLDLVTALNAFFDANGARWRLVTVVPISKRGGVIAYLEFEG